MKILHVISSVSAEGGGPIEGIIQLARPLQALGHQVEIASMDDPAAPHLKNFPLKVHALGPTSLKYSFGFGVVPWLEAHAQDYDILVVNGVWQYHSLATWRAVGGRRPPYVVFTHGMLDPWFKHAYRLKHLKKSLYWRLAEHRVLNDAATVIFTCEEEKLLARLSFQPYRVRESVVNYGTATPPQDAAPLRGAFVHAFPALDGKKYLLFLGRIHPKKGCDLLVRAFAALARELGEYHLVMAGPDPDEWRTELMSMVEDPAVSARIHWTGMLKGDQKWGAIHGAAAFCLPSHQENFGIAVAEALGCGINVILSNKVNIWRELEADGAAIVHEDNQADTIAALRRWLALTDEDRRIMGDRARDSFQRRFTAEAMAQSLLDILEPIVANARVES